MSVTPSQFAEKVLSGIGAPVTQNNLNAMLAWMAFEGGHWHNKASYNPLNTTQSMPGSTKAPGTIVQAYPDWATGLAATVKTLGYGYYTAIVKSFRANADPAVTLQAVKVSPWGTTALPVANWPTLAAQMKKESASPGTLGFPWGWVVAPAVGIAGGLALGVGVIGGAALGAAGYGAYSLARKYIL